MDIYKIIFNSGPLSLVIMDAKPSKGVTNTIPAKIQFREINAFMLLCSYFVHIS